MERTANECRSEWAPSVNYFFRWRRLELSFSQHCVRGLESQTYPCLVHGPACLKHTGGAVYKGWVSLARNMVFCRLRAGR